MLIWRNVESADGVISSTSLAKYLTSLELPHLIIKVL